MSNINEVVVRYVAAWNERDPKRRRDGRRSMGVLHPRCADLDVHRETVVAYVRHMANGTVNREVRTFKTTCWPCRNGWPARGSRTWRWRRPESIGNRFGTF